MKRWTTAMAVVAALTTMTAGGAAAVAKQQGAPSLRQLQAQAAGLRVQINLARAQLSAVMGEMRRLDGLVSTEQAIVEADRSAAAAADARVQAAQAHLSQLQAEGAADRATLVNRAIDLYEHPYQYAQILLSGTDSLQQLTDRQVLADAVQARTNDVIDSVRHDTIAQQAAAKELAADKVDADQRHAVATAELQRLQTALSSKQQVAVAVQTRINDDDSKLAAVQPQIASVLAANEARLRASIAAIHGQAAVADPVLGPVGSYGLQWPIAGAVTQEFGHDGHPGIDIAAAYGSPIHAAGTGVVIYASWESGYGNYTCISHGGGISTCYGHQSAIYVSVGQTVTRGQVIGAEGSTGYSTGPHVHFEVRVNGAVRNPRLFVPGNP